MQLSQSFEKYTLIVERKGTEDYRDWFLIDVVSDIKF